MEPMFGSISIRATKEEKKEFREREVKDEKLRKKLIGIGGDLIELREGLYPKLEQLTQTIKTPAEAVIEIVSALKTYEKSGGGAHLNDRVSDFFEALLPKFPFDEEQAKQARQIWYGTAHE